MEKIVKTSEREEKEEYTTMLIFLRGGIYGDGFSASTKQGEIYLENIWDTSVRWLGRLVLLGRRM